jgi:hypothetical protein
MSTATSLGPAEQKVLRQLLNARAAVARGKSKNAGAALAVDRLRTLGLVREMPPARKGPPRLELTAEGRRCAEEVVRRYPARITAHMLYGELLRISDGLEELRSRISSIEPHKPVYRNGSFLRELRTAIGEVDRRGRHGGLVPIPELRRALAPLCMSREDFDRALLEQERAFAVDLKTAHDPTSMKDADQAVWDEGRGWLYYAVAR